MTASYSQIMAQTVNIDSLTRAAVEYNNVFVVLPAFSLNDTAARLRLNIVDVQYEDRFINKRRSAGIIKPYSAGVELGESAEMVKFFETVLRPELIFAEVVDDINSYRPRKVLSNQGEWVDNKTKKHPLEAEIIRDIILSFSEDVSFQLFFAERDEETLTPATAFTGFNPVIDQLVTDGHISSGNQNLVTTGAIAAPANDTDYQAYEKFVAFVSAAHPLLRQGEVLLYCGETPVNYARQALQNKLKNQEYPTRERFLECLRSDANCPNLTLLIDPVLGTGNRLILAKPGLFDIGVNSNTDQQFVQVRAPFRDPNSVQFWIQAAFGTRIRDVHRKVFQVNDQANTSLSELAGDYVAPVPEAEG